MPRSIAAIGGESIALFVVAVALVYVWFHWGFGFLLFLRPDRK